MRPFKPLSPWRSDDLEKQQLRAIIMAQEARLAEQEAQLTEQRARIEQLERDLDEKLQAIEALKAESLSLVATRDAEHLIAEIVQLKETLKKRDKALFAPSTERIVGPAGTGTVVKPHKAPKKGHGPSPQPRLERIEKRHELPADDRECEACGGTLAEMKGQTEDAEEVSVVERRFVLIVHRRQKYRCACNGQVETAPGPKKLIPGGRYSSEFAVEIATAKYADHLPLERQVRILDREGLKVTSSTLWDQIEAVARLATPTYDAIRAEVLKAPVVGADETHWPLLVGEKVEENKRWQTWCMATPNLVSYRILPSRSTEAAREVLNGYRGTAVSDGYAAYQSLAGSLPVDATFRLAHCWAHVRRKFVEASDNFPEECDEILALIRELYEVEKEAQEGDESTLLERRARLRNERSRAIVKRIYAWADTVRALPRSSLGQAISYMKGLKAGLTVFLDDPRVPIDNNHTERALRGLVVGRKNHYGSKSRRGTEVAAIFYTLLESAKLSGVEPKAYLQAVVDRALAERGAVLLPRDFKSS